MKVIQGIHGRWSSGVCSALVASALLIASCGGGGGDQTGSGRKAGLDSANRGCDGNCANQRLTVADVTRILQQGVAAANFLGRAATFAITDRVGNVLAVYQMPGAAGTTTINGQIGATGGLEGLAVPSTAAAISKAGTGAYLSSQGNAFSTRVASQIVQEFFNPGENGQGSGPLFGVQFSQLPCSDVTVLDSSLTGGIPSGDKFKAPGLVGPRPLPLGLSADPGGIPLYTEGDLVGGIGVELDGAYTLDRNVRDSDNAPEEYIALAAAIGFEIPSERAGNQIIVGGKSLRTVDLSYDDIMPLEQPLPDLDLSGLVAVPLFTNGTIRQGAVFGDAESGVLQTARAGIPAGILVDGAGNQRYPTRAGAALEGGIQLAVSEVDALLDSVLATAFRTRAAIRRPLDVHAHVTIWVVDTLGNPLGMVRTFDAPVFGIDVSLQKGRSAVFFSSPDAGVRLREVAARNGVGAFNDYPAAQEQLLGTDVLSGNFAVTDRAIGNMSRPFFPDGIRGRGNGPFSLPFPGDGDGRTWSPFNTGLQLDLAFQRIAQPLGIPQNPPASLPDSCTDSGVLGRRLQNGLQIFPGSVPIYRNGRLVGGVGISGDGVDQDDLIAFYGSSRQGLDFVGHTAVGDPQYGFNAPREIRVDRLESNVENIRIRYVNCPESPFVNDNTQRVCKDL